MQGCLAFPGAHLVASQSLLLYYFYNCCGLPCPGRPMYERDVFSCQRSRNCALLAGVQAGIPRRPWRRVGGKARHGAPEQDVHKGG